MARILTGIQSTGNPHLGNLFGVIFPSIELANSKEGSFFFIADLHSLTHIKDPKILKKFTYKVASVWLSCGLDSGSDRVALYRQSDVPEVTELAWYLTCFYPYQRLKLTHSFKDKLSYLDDVNTGLFTYPLLMASDILLSDAEKIPLGRDQLQHIEITREIAKRFNREMGDIFILPEPIVNEWFIPGLDGKKMSKSRGNVIDIFLSDMELQRQVMTIKTDNSHLHATKNTDRDIVYYLYKLLASKKKVYEMKDSYLEGDYGYFQAKEALYSLLLDSFSIEREKFAFFIQNPFVVEKILAKGALKASKAAKITIDRIRKALGFGDMAEFGLN
ncbi:tryptophanyl-tRNA synthetase [Candidatus Uzinura diaspidicola str. ASNER]|uniref:Tryptophan--tRNA ligase n=1 Tax=Candidatus Uzinura diaspidicola str. ASNER TaxID=1133592 RepID=L7VJV3_9FLAO|nr:tryptophanyl-tRNA synthetase [Candidatus Uzinura diaspidicola str. ASNER]